MSTKVQELVEKARSLTQEERTELIGELMKFPKRPGTTFKTEAERVAFIKSLRGKYRDVLTPSEDFMRERREENERDDGRW